ncbi:lipopolysaccharide transport periplasmic protein LptA [Geoalkalibacter subterraneus]|uniref:lipopolysaccharide transport periplasmic protein LptA n=1 Tax=Geoalkalibacter subterraneus TaxID=483547 RepID=UPI00069417CA|nr:lipopolysaccharide transport periplasmic protein LptA [Geoalkalibacter subterraneus]
MIRLCLVFLVALCGAPVWVHGAEPLGFSDKEPVKVTSESMEALSDPRRIFFTGDAVARQGDLTIEADQLRIFFDQNSEVIERIEAEGGVRIEQGNRVATGEHGVMHQQQAIIVLTGSPRITEGDDFVEGDEITVFLNENRSTVRGEGSSRVRAIFHPKDEKDGTQ